MRIAAVLLLTCCCACSISCSHAPAEHPSSENSESSAGTGAADTPAGTVVFAAGLDPEPVDHGRPVALIAGALGVESQVFRDAFSRVTPARGGHPSPSLARRNKDVLMNALSRYCITNERLDEVSDYYRYRREAGEMWPHQPASARVVMKNGQISDIELIDGGHGYLTAPDVIVVGHEQINVEAVLEFSSDFQRNGRVSSLKLIE